MKNSRKILAWLLILLAGLIAWACASAEKTTLMVYMCGSDMQEEAVEDLYEMAEAETGGDVTIVVLAGGAEEWGFEEFIDGSRTLLVLKDGYIEESEDWGRGSMGSPECLSRFLAWGMTRYPADRTIVVLWNHGGGSEGGVCFDLTAEEDSLTLTEIDEALRTTAREVPGYHINLFACDACMMATYELAAVLSQYNIETFAGSEETEPDVGWPYKDWLDALGRNPGMSDRELCIALVDAYMEGGLRENPDDYLTFSAVSLREMGALQAAMERFGASMTGQLERGNLSDLRRGRSRIYTFGSFDDGSWDMVDLGALLDAYALLDPDAASEARQCLNRAVIANRQTSNLETCSGLSVLVPQDTTDEFEYYAEGMNLTGVIPNWTAFVRGYARAVRDGHYGFTASGAGTVTPEDVMGEIFLPTGVLPSGSVTWDDERGSYETAEAEGTEVSISDGEQGFTATLPVDQLPYLDYVEGMLLIDMSDEEGEFYVELGLTRNNLTDWNTGRVVSLFDGSWPMLGGQIVPIYDQTRNDHSVRSLIPVKLNGEYTYLVVVFPAGSTEGRVIGANAGYDSNGLPIRETKKLQPGDQIVPVYTLYYSGDEELDLQESEYEGEAFRWEEGMTVNWTNMEDGEEPFEMLFCFVFNDIFGEYTMSEFVSFRL